AKNLVKEIEADHKRFIELRAVLDDPDDGVQANVGWIEKHKTDIEALVTATNTKVAELDAQVASTEMKIKTMGTRYAEFKTLAAQVFDGTTGLEALSAAAKEWHLSIKTYHL